MGAVELDWRGAHRLKLRTVSKRFIHPRYFHLYDCYKSPSLAVVMTVVSLMFVLK